ncbi:MULTISPECIES: dipeptide epimerase [Sphingobacterium]|uniref:dipeptide epimerase n=1 Tax=Sphingobacterium TaxID=28453 RepID=UPI00104E77CC|nr:MULTISPECIES: dipeptide epimerase [Sphingobacterium]MBB2952491.1 L-alanine-DL-glutamate epimerase-like enolase superfamily enzyme [Sphingobacterium sp. JUb56]MCS3557460.1 L-alanine-DL-glutamate epimerase-like enolase superfamily enzyme [Sphingobacterium sp. JUb21]MCW2260949.1 L-alanine-DL-glutamate epimerase-like enolase superfamily enzyme [Sphingobacterium kitahiroshimense]TCQ96252.1 L-alanine-DL-glutamate epimerase-like enolase superfamily enzyme [Sphingobacterium sp. JUb20]TCR08415.1 L-a
MSTHSDWITKDFGAFKLRYKPYTLEMRYVFTVASFSRTTTPVVLTQLEYDGIIGYGEASMPPYLGESQESVINFLNKIDLSGFNSPFQTEELLAYVDQISAKNTAAKASVDIALHDLIGKILGQPFYKIWGLNPALIPATSYTIGIDTEEVIRKKVMEADQFKILKVKLGLETDKMIIDTIRQCTDRPLCADVNQGWKTKEQALEMSHWLAERGVVFLEQPMPKEQIDDNAWLTAHSPIPTIADEACQRLSDVPALQGVYSGINIKLMKCTGMREAKRMAELAQSLKMKVMIGCMTETSCAISAAAQLAPLVDWADLDGALLIGNDIYDGMKVIDGQCILPDRPGIGILAE